MTLPNILLGFSACAVTCLSLGLVIVRELKLNLNRLESLCLGYVLGSVAVSLLTLAIGFLSIARKGVFLSLAMMAVVLCWRLWPWFRKLQPAPLRSVPVFYRYLFGGAWLVYGALYLRHALAPEASPDGAVYHLGLVNLWSHAHGISKIVDIYAALPHAVEMLFLFAFSIGRHSAAALVHFSFLMLLPVLMLLWGIRFTSRGGGRARRDHSLRYPTGRVGWVRRVQRCGAGGCSVRGCVLVGDLAQQQVGGNSGGQQSSCRVLF